MRTSLLDMCCHQNVHKQFTHEVKHNKLFKTYLWWFRLKKDFFIIYLFSDGIDRTGAFCTLCIGMEQVRAEDTVDVFHVIKHLRTQRPHMVLTVVSFWYV